MTLDTADPAALAAAGRGRTLLRGWRRRLGFAVGFALRRPDAAVSALAGFVVRGGFLVLLAPIVVLPTPFTIAGTFAISGFTIDARPTAWFITVAAVGCALCATWLVAAGIVGSFVDARLVERAAEATGRPPGEEPIYPPSETTLLRMLGIRALCLVPLAVALVWAGLAVADTVRAEFFTPEDLATPLVVRVVVRTTGPLAVVAAVWFASESFGALAIRRLLLARAGALRAVRDAIVEIVRRPVSTLLTAALAYGLSALLLLGQIVGGGFAFAATVAAARNDSHVPSGVERLDPSVSHVGLPLLPLAALLLAAVWLLSLVLSAVLSSWRSALFTAEVEHAIAASGTASAPELGLSHQPTARSGD